MYLTPFMNKEEVLILLIDHWLLYFLVRDMFFIFKGKTQVSNILNIKVFNFEFYIQFPGVLKRYVFHHKNSEFFLRIGSEILNPLSACDNNKLCVWKFEKDIFWISFVSVRIENRFYDIMSMMRISDLSKVDNVRFFKCLGGVTNFVQAVFDNKLYTINRFNFLTGWDVGTQGMHFEMFKFNIWKLPYEERTTRVKEFTNPQFVGFGTEKGQIFILNLKNFAFIHEFKIKENTMVHDFIEDRRYHPEIFIISIGRTYKSLRKFQVYQGVADRMYREYSKKKYPIYGYIDINEARDEELYQRRHNEDLNQFRLRMDRYQKKMEKEEM
jgi:hypothetical protein